MLNYFLYSTRTLGGDTAMKVTDFLRFFVFHSTIAMLSLLPENYKHLNYFNKNSL